MAENGTAESGGEPEVECEVKSRSATGEVLLDLTSGLVQPTGGSQ
ncbi:MAG: hypothetical protein K0S98_1456, partial [Propionibacteriaceae bacterium]|nr:hypothetical protein [Propionibacteriaceae bacterium]